VCVAGSTVVDIKPQKALSACVCERVCVRMYVSMCVCVGVCVCMCLCVSVCGGREGW